MKQMSLSETGFDCKTKSTRKREFLSEMNLVVTWAELVALIASHMPKPGAKVGRPPCPALDVFRQQVAAGDTTDCWVYPNFRFWPGTYIQMWCDKPELHLSLMSDRCSSGLAVAMPVEPVLELGRRQGLGVAVALSCIAAHYSELLGHFGLLYALGCGPQSQAVGNLDDCLDDRAILGILVQLGDETAVDLELVRVQVLQVGEA